MTVTNYFPPEILGPFQADRWSTMLTRAREAPLRTVETDQPMTLRFCMDYELFLPKLVVRVRRSGDGWYIVTKVLDGLRHTDIELAWEHERTLVGSDAEQLQQLVDGARLWDMPTTVSRLGLDGVSWLIECAERGRYHVLDRWAPEERSLLKLGEFLWRVSGVWQYRPDARLVQQRIAQKKADRKAAEAAKRRAKVREEAIRRSNRTVRKLAATLEAHGVMCPHCGERRKDMRFVERTSPVASFFICTKCGRSFAPVDSEPVN